MNPIAHWVGGTTLCIGLALGATSTTFAQTFPTDEAQLYEAAKKEGTVVTYVSAPLDTMNAIAADFGAKYPGVKVEVLRIVGVAQYQRFVMETQAKQYIADVLSMSDEPSVADLIANGHIAEWKVPTHDRFPPDMRLKTFAYSPNSNALAFIYNVNKVTPEEVKILQQDDWRGILDPRFKGRIATTSQNSGGTYIGLDMILNPAFKDRFGVPFLKAVAAQHLAVYGDTAIIPDRVAAGDNDIGIWPGENGGSVAKWQSGAPIRWVFPKPTPVWGSSWQAVSKYAPHPNAARLYQNWLLSEDGAKSIQVNGGGASNLIGYPDIRAVAKEAWYPKIVERYVPDWDRWAREFDSSIAIWTKILKESQ